MCLHEILGVVVEGRAQGSPTASSPKGVALRALSTTKPESGNM